MTTKEFKRVARLLKQVYKEIQEEALNSGISLLSPEYDKIISVAREKVLSANGYTLEEYRKAKAKVAGFSQSDLVEHIEEKEEKLEELDKRHIPTEDEISQIAERVAELVAKKYIVPPQVINKIVKEKTIEKPQIVETVRIQREEYNAEPLKKDIEKKIENVYKKIEGIKIPEINGDKLKQEIFNGLQKKIIEDINILGMPNFRKLAMGLQAQIDDLKSTTPDVSSFIIGDGVAKLTVGTTQPTNPSIGDLWYDTN